MMLDDKTDSVFLLNSSWVEPQAIVQFSSRGLGHGIERLSEQAFAEEVLAQSLHPLT